MGNKKLNKSRPAPGTLQAIVERFPSFGRRRAVGYRGEFGLRWWSYARLYEECYRVAGLLKDRGIQPGEYLLLHAPSCPEWVAFFMGAALRGVIVVPLDENSSTEVVTRVAKKVKPSLFVHDPALSTNPLSLPAVSIYLPDPGGRPVPGKDVTVAVDRNDTALINFTSGTTAVPRGVIITHGNLTAAIRPFQAWRYLLRLLSFRLLCLAPLSRVLGLMLGICVPLSIGLSVIYTRSIQPKHLVRVIHDNQITLLATVPKVLQILSSHLRKQTVGHEGRALGQRLNGVRLWLFRRHILFRLTRKLLGYPFSVILVGGAVLPVEEERFWRDAGYVFVQGYGLTEITAFGTVNPPLFGSLGAIGKPAPHLDMRIAADGEVLMRGPTVTPGYFQDEVANTEAFVDGYFRTGDLVQYRAGKRLYFRGRKKEMIVTGAGDNVFPGEVESVLGGLQGVRDSVVFGAHGRDGAEEVHATLLLVPGANADEVIASANTRLEPHQRIGNWTVWPEPDFPRGALLKPQRKEIAERVRRCDEHDSHGATIASSVPTVDDVSQEADRNRRLQLIAQFLLHTPLEELAGARRGLAEQFGLSSLDMAELLILLEDQRGAVLDNIVSFGALEQMDACTLREALTGGTQGAAATKPPPTWSESAPARLLGHVYRDALIHSWLYLRSRLRVSGVQHLADIEPPFILAAVHHEHAIDVFALYCALPARLRRKLMVVSSDWAFREYLDPQPQHRLSRRVLARCAFHIGVPALFPFTMVPRSGASAHGLMQTCRLIDRGHSPIIFPERFRNTGSENNPIQPGLALMALQCQVPVVPARLCDNERIDFRPRARRVATGVTFGQPVRVFPAMTQQALIKTLERRIAELRGAEALP